jgi:FkbM family methyltransferase
MAQDSRQATVADVFYAYRLILGREPDAIGLKENLQQVVENELTVDRLRTAFLSSSEFATRTNKLSRVQLHGGLWAVVDAEDPEFGKVISETGGWEPHIVAEILRQVKSGDVFVDVGANVGVMSFPASRAVGPTGKVISFEPNPRNVQSFLHGIVENGFQNVDLYPFALSDRQQVFSVTGGSNSYLTPALLGSTLIQSYVGDDILSREEHVDFIKLDIEGHEPAALKGLTKTIQHHKPGILCEFNPRCLAGISNVEPGQFAQQIFDMSQSCIAIEYDGRQNPVESAAALMDLWTHPSSATPMTRSATSSKAASRPNGRRSPPRCGRRTATHVGRSNTPKPNRMKRVCHASTWRSLPSVTKITLASTAGIA